MYKIVEVYDGRLPEYQIINEINDSQRVIIKRFDTMEEAEQWLNGGKTPCGEEDPCE